MTAKWSNGFFQKRGLRAHSDRLPRIPINDPEIMEVMTVGNHDQLVAAIEHWLKGWDISNACAAIDRTLDPEQ